MKRISFVPFLALMFLCSHGLPAQDTPAPDAASTASPSQSPTPTATPAQTPTQTSPNTTVSYPAPPEKFDPLPAPVSNNAVASIHVGKHSYIFSFMGIGAKKTWDAITTNSYELDEDTGKWTAINPVPGAAGRIAASAVAARGQVFLFGGYTVDGQGGEITVPDVSVFEPIYGNWARAADIPIAVDDAVAGVFHDRYIYLVSGWGGSKAIANVQRYDLEKNRWTQATPIPGTPVFAHAGAIVGETIVYVDGAHEVTADGQTRRVASDECWMGKIDRKHPERIQWSKLPPHPGTARFRIAAGVSEKDEKIYFSGGSDNPYSFNGTGYDGNPAEPSPLTFDYDVRHNKWETVTENTPDPTMDHRGLIVRSHDLVVIGGMEKGQQVTAKVVVVEKGKK
jgi:N-acetylneuraminic acid mutarotase